MEIPGPGQVNHQTKSSRQTEMEISAETRIKKKNMNVSEEQTRLDCYCYVSRDREGCAVLQCCSSVTSVRRNSELLISVVMSSLRFLPMYDTKHRTEQMSLKSGV